MNSALGSVFEWGLRWSRRGVVGTLIFTLTANIFVGEISIAAQLTIALLALLVGIPHGAIDHLISIPSRPRLRFFGYIALYVLIAVLAGWAIAIWNINGFRAVLLMSALHFGFGDASYRNESLEAQGGTREPTFISVLYALPAGFLPVILPLTDSRTLSALERINPLLKDWAGSYGTEFRSITFGLAGVAIIILAAMKRISMVIDLILLLLLSLLAPPLIAFACYFGFWHALRHTARLVPKLPSALERASHGDRNGALQRAIFPGLYAVLGTLLVALIAMIWFPKEFSYSLLWATLVIVWALTVPHMITTSRFDKKALS